MLPIERCSRPLAPTLRRSAYDLDYREFLVGHVMPTEMIDAGGHRAMALSLMTAMTHLLSHP